MVEKLAEYAGLDRGDEKPPKVEKFALERKKGAVGSNNFIEEIIKHK